MKKISIITINLNNKSGLDKTITSVLSQAYKDYEFIIIDGYSIDGSVELIKKHSCLITYWISEKDNGIYDAMNKGILQAKGEYLIFLNSGDLLHGNDVLLKCVNIMNNFKEVDIFYGDIAVIHEEKETIWTHPKDLNISFFKENNLCHQSAFVKSNIFKEYGMHPIEYKLAGDHWMFLVAFVNNKNFLHLEQLLVNRQPDGIGVQARDKYQIEMSQMWSNLVPPYANDLVDKYLKVDYAIRYPFLEKIVEIHKFFIYKKKIVLLLFLLIFIVLIILKII